jgi:septum formation protein
MPEARPRLILASSSARRRDLLRLLGLPFVIRPSRVDEQACPLSDPLARARHLAMAKAREVARRVSGPAWALGADTLVVARGSILEKPATDDEASVMLRRLAGRWHTVITAVALVPQGVPGARSRSGACRSRVRFASLTPAGIRWLLAAGEHHDKAGAYALQGRAAAFITDQRGTASNVVGLPLDLVARLLGQAGLLPPLARARARRSRDQVPEARKAR